MKLLKLAALSLISFAFLAAMIILPTRLLFEEAVSYTFFCGDTSKNCREIKTARCASLLKATLPDVCGECAEYEKDGFDLERFLSEKGAEVKFCETLSDSVNYYCSANLPYSVQLYGEEINLHVSVKGERVLVASPIIFGGY